MTHYNLTGYQNATGIADIIFYNETITGGLFMSVFIIALFFIILAALMKRGTQFDDAMLVTTFICFTITVLLRMGGLINDYFMFGFGTLMAFVAFWIVTTRRN